MWLISYFAINSPRGRNVSHFDDVCALRSEGQVSASVTDIRGPQRCGEMSARLAPSPCDEARTDVQGGGPNVTRQAETGMIQPCSKDGGRRGETEMRAEGEEGYREHMAQEKKD